MVVLALIIGAAVLITGSSAQSEQSAWGNKFVSPSELGEYSHGAVSANGKECAAIGKSILEKNGTAVDGAIATLICEGIASLHNMGLGGGFFMTIWDPKNGGTAEFLNAREAAPGEASENMFGRNARLAFSGGKSVAVPGELLGYWEAHQKYGRVAWKELFEPSIKLCREGAEVTQYLEDQLKAQLQYIKEEPTMSEILIDPNTGSTWKLGDKIRRPRLAEFLETISNVNKADGVKTFYGGAIGAQLIEEIKGFGGIMTIDDLRNYTVEWSKPIEAKLGNLTMYTAPPPASGVILTFIMNVLQGLLPAPNEKVFWQRVIETFKYAYARRTELGDPDFVDTRDLIANLTSTVYAEQVRKRIKDDSTNNTASYYGATVQPFTDHGTGNVAVLASDGSAVSVTSTVNQVLGAMIRSASTGIIFNDQMDDFSAPEFPNGFDLPPCPTNFIKPGKRPLSSMAPTVVVDENKHVRLVVGGAGGTKITTAVALTMALHLYSGYNVKEAVDSRRLHHQLIPMAFVYEPNFNATIVRHLEHIGHKSSTTQRLGSAITVISQDNGVINANSDIRREGSIAGF